MGELANPLKLRAHHLLCLLGFRGLGYSPEFAETMGRVLKEFHSNVEIPVTLVTECDLICASCPHKQEGECRKSEGAAARIKDKDSNILKKLGYRTNSRTTPAEAWRRVKKNISMEELTAMCSRCQWVELGYCQEGLANLRNGQAGTFPH